MKRNDFTLATAKRSTLCITENRYYKSTPITAVNSAVPNLAPGQWKKVRYAISAANTSPTTMTNARTVGFPIRRATPAAP